MIVDDFKQKLKNHPNFEESIKEMEVLCWRLHPGEIKGIEKSQVKASRNT